MAVSMQHGPPWTQSRCLEGPSAWRTSADAQARTTLRMPPLPTCVHRWLHRGEVSCRRFLVRAKPSNPGDDSGYTQGNRANRLCCDETGEVVLVPCGDLSPEA